MRGDTGFPVRMRYAKRGPVRFIGHRDVARAFERAFRIAELPLAFSAGFSPHPKVSFGPALAVGYESDAEYLDVELAEALDDERLVRDVTGGLSRACWGRRGRNASFRRPGDGRSRWLFRSSARLSRRVR